MSLSDNVTLDEILSRGADIAVVAGYETVLRPQKSGCNWWQKHRSAKAAIEDTSPCEYCGWAKHSEHVRLTINDAAEKYVQSQTEDKSNVWLNYLLDSSFQKPAQNIAQRTIQFMRWDLSENVDLTRLVLLSKCLVLWNNPMTTDATEVIRAPSPYGRCARTLLAECFSSVDLHGEMTLLASGGEYEAERSAASMWLKEHTTDGLIEASDD